MTSMAGEPEAGGSSQAIWNPKAAAWWSLLFTPAFGAYVQMLNWQALGEPEKAAESRGWFYGSLAAIFLLAVLRLYMGPHSGGNAMGLVLLLVWYNRSGRSQVQFVTEKFGSAYVRKSWGTPLLSGIGAMVAYVAAVAFVATLADRAP